MFDKSVDLTFLSRNEWALVLDLMMGHYFICDVSVRDEVLRGICSSAVGERLHSKWHVNADFLQRKLDALPREQWDIIRDVIEGFWDGPNPDLSSAPGKSF